MTLVVFTGPAESGKSTAAKLLAHSSGLEVINVGDVLLTELEDAGVTVRSRAQIGSSYMQRFGSDGYERCISGIARSGRIIDGIRLLAGLDIVRVADPGALHIHRPGSAVVKQDVDTQLIELRADAVLQWQPSLAVLASHVEALARRIAASS